MKPWRQNSIYLSRICCGIFVFIIVFCAQALVILQNIVYNIFCIGIYIVFVKEIL